ncbi:MAG: GTP-binding protein [Candidatus Helarchaeota archaeon]|nr:GTP-binding protein [Candidatus Helarchaeota archaeon]
MSEYVFKIIIIGDPAVGKTSLINRFIQDTFEADYKETIGTNILRKTVTFEKDTINLTLWDIAGQERWTDMRHVYYQGSSGCIMVYDVSRPITFKHIEDYWFTDFKNFCKEEKVPVILVANKNDMPAKLKRVDSFEGNELGGRVSAFRFLETSALTGQNVEEAFKALSKVLVAQEQAKENK